MARHKTLFDHEGPLPTRWPEELNPRFVEAGLRARQIRERTRRTYAAQSVADAVPSASEAPAAELGEPVHVTLKKK